MNERLKGNIKASETFARPMLLEGVYLFDRMKEPCLATGSVRHDTSWKRMRSAERRKRSSFVPD